MEGTWISLLPFVTVVFFSLWLKEILPGLIIGLLLGAYLNDPNLLGGTIKSINYLENILMDKTNIEIILFLYLFGGLVGMMQISGGIKGFAEFIRPYIDTERKVLMLTWLSVPFTFMTPMFRIMMMAPILQALKGKINMSKKQIGYILDISTEPIIVLIPIGTAFVGYMVSVVSLAIGENSLQVKGLDIFLKSIPFNFFAIIMLIIGILTSFLFKLKEGQVQKEVDKSTQNLHRSSIKKELAQVNAKPFNLFLPLFLLLTLTISILWINGYQGGARTILQAFTTADTTLSMLIAIFLTLIISALIYVLRKEPLGEVIYHFFDGGNQMMTAITLLILVWAVALSAEELGFSLFIANTFGDLIPAWLVPTVIFLGGSLIGYFIGTSWGTWGLFMPLGVSLAISTGASIPLTVGAVFASGTFGAFASPLGDTTITTATILEMSPISYAKYKFKIALLGVGLSVLFYLLVALLIT